MSERNGNKPSPTTPQPEMSPADKAAHVAASYVRPAADRTLTTYERRDVRTTMSRVLGR